MPKKTTGTEGDQKQNRESTETPSAPFKNRSMPEIPKIDYTDRVTKDRTLIEVLIPLIKDMQKKMSEPKEIQNQEQIWKLMDDTFKMSRNIVDALEISKYRDELNATIVAPLREELIGKIDKVLTTYTQILKEYNEKRTALTIETFNKLKQAVDEVANFKMESLIPVKVENLRKQMPTGAKNYLQGKGKLSEYLATAAKELQEVANGKKLEKWAMLEEALMVARGVQAAMEYTVGHEKYEQMIDSKRRSELMEVAQSMIATYEKMLHDYNQNGREPNEQPMLDIIDRLAKFPMSELRSKVVPMTASFRLEQSQKYVESCLKPLPIEQANAIINDTFAKLKTKDGNVKSMENLSDKFRILAEAIIERNVDMAPHAGSTADPNSLQVTAAFTDTFSRIIPTVFTLLDEAGKLDDVKIQQEANKIKEKIKENARLFIRPGLKDSYGSDLLNWSDLSNFLRQLEQFEKDKKTAAPKKE